MSEQSAEEDADSAPPATVSPPKGASPEDGIEEVGRQMVVAVGESDAVDLTRYKTDELKQRFQSLFGVTNMIPWAAAGLAGPLLAAMAVWSLLFLSQPAPIVAAIMFAYMVVQGLFCGIFLAALLVVARLLQQLGAVVDITLQTIREALRDLQNIADPKARAELSGALIHGVILPTVKTAVTVKLGLLKVPLSFVLNRILGKTADKLSDAIKTKMIGGDDESDRPRPEPAPPADAPDDGAESHLDNIQERIELIARRTRRATLIPTAVVFGAVTAVTSLPWVVVWLLIN